MAEEVRMQPADIIINKKILCNEILRNIIIPKNKRHDYKELPSFIAVISITGISVSCNKTSSGKPSFTGNNTLPGTWEIRGMWRPLIDINPNAFRPGNGNTWSFIDSVFEQRTKDSVCNTGTYMVDNSGINPDGNKPV